MNTNHLCFDTLSCADVVFLLRWSSSPLCPPLPLSHHIINFILCLPLFLSSAWNTRTSFLPLTLSVSPPFFFICLPPQSDLILLVTVDIWGPAHRGTLWIPLNTAHTHTAYTHLSQTHAPMYSINPLTYCGCLDLNNFKIRILWSAEETGSSIYNTLYSTLCMYFPPSTISKYSFFSIIDAWNETFTQQTSARQQVLTSSGRSVSSTCRNNKLRYVFFTIAYR